MLVGEKNSWKEEMFGGLKKETKEKNEGWSDETKGVIISLKGESRSEA